MMSSTQSPSFPRRGLLPVLLLCVPAQAVQLTESHSIDLLDHGIQSATYSKAVAGCFRIPSIRDLAFLNADDLVISSQPGLFSDVDSLYTDVTDLVVRRMEQGVDQLFALVAGTPRRVEYSANPGWFFSAVSGVGSNQTRLIGGDVDGDGGDDLISYSSSTGVVKGYRFNSSASDDVSLYYSFTLQATAIDLVSLNWGGTDRAELAVLTSSSVRIYDQAGALQASYPCPSGTTCLTAFRNSGEGEDRLAWFWEGNGGQVAGQVVFDGGQEGPYSLDSNGIAGVSTGDYNDDGETDLALTSRGRSGGVVLMQSYNWNKATIDSFSIGSSENVTFSADTQPGGTARQVAALLGDFDNDGDLDLAHADQYGEEIMVFKSAEVYAPSLAPRFEGGVVYINGWNQDGTPNQDPRGFAFTAFGPAYTIPEIGTPSELWLTVYVQNGLSGPLLADTTGTVVFPIYTSPSSPICLSDVVLDMPHLARDDGRVYYMHVRFASDQLGETRFYTPHLEMDVNTPSITDMIDHMPGFDDLMTFVPDQVVGGGGKMAGIPWVPAFAPSVPVFGPQPVDGSGRVPIPDSPPL